MIDIIFLDIDGVLNTRDWRNSHPFKMGWDGWKSQIDPYRVGHLNEIIKSTGARIVLSSTWRFTWDANGIGELLHQCGIDDASYVMDTTNPKIKDRLDAIVDWIANNGPVNYVAIDDDDLSPLGDRWVCTQDLTGLDFLRASRAIDILMTTGRR